MSKKEKYILWFKEIGKDDISLVGGKGANLGEMFSFGVPVPDGFVVTTKAYYDFLSSNKLTYQIDKILEKIDYDSPDDLEKASVRLKKMIHEAPVPKEISNQIMKSYLKLGTVFSHSYVAVRSSATAEDLGNASFAGQQVTFLNVRGESLVAQKVKECWASLFQARAIFYRHQKGFDHLKVGIAVPVQKMIPSEVSGVMFTIDPVNGSKNHILVEAVWGLGELIVQGEVSPDSYLVNKRTFDIEKVSIEKQMVELVKVGNKNKLEPVPKSRQLRRKLSDSQIVKIAKIGESIHRHYYYPQDIEWAVYKDKIYIVQTRPVTAFGKEEPAKKQPVIPKSKVILTGTAASPGIATGPARVIMSPKEMSKVHSGDILVATMTTPDYVPVMKKVSGIVTDKGGKTSHAAIVSRELGIPCVVGTGKGTSVLKNDRVITINGEKGEIYIGNPYGKINKGVSEKTVRPLIPQAQNHIKTATKLYVNLAEPNLAKEVSLRNVDGIGLLRAEFMIAELGVHPKKLIKDKKQALLVKKLAGGIRTICEAFSPRPVIYRTTDFKTNEYRNLVGGEAYEPKEENPFIGYRGALRYVADPEVFEVELEAIKTVRNTYGCKNLWLMIPFCRTPDELMKVKKLIVSAGLIRSPSFKLMMMVEVPSNVVILEEFIKAGIDGVSIGSNDLTMLMLGADRDNVVFSSGYNEMDPAVYWAVEHVIRTCHKHKISCSICGQAPSVYEDFLEKIVQWGITSVSINPDRIEETRKLIYSFETARAKKKG